MDGDGDGDGDGGGHEHGDGHVNKNGNESGREEKSMIDAEAVEIPQKAREKMKEGDVLKLSKTQIQCISCHWEERSQVEGDTESKQGVHIRRKRDPRAAKDGP